MKKLIQINQNQIINGNVYFHQIKYFGKDLMLQLVKMINYVV